MKQLHLNKIYYILLFNYLLMLFACSRTVVDEKNNVQNLDFATWKWYISDQENYAVFGPSQHTSSVLKVQTPQGELSVPVTYFRVNNDIFYISSQMRHLPGTDTAILEAQARGIEGKFTVGTITREPFVHRGCVGLRLYIQRPDSYKIAELIATCMRTYQVVTDLASTTAPRMQSIIFRFSFTPLDGCQ